MGLYIEKMELPKGGNETIIRILPNGEILDQYGHHLGVSALSVPPHGQLDDQDRLEKMFADIEHAPCSCFVSDFAIVFYSDRLEIEQAFNEWAEKNGVVKVPNAIVAFLEINGLLNAWKTVEWCRARRQKKQAEEGET